MSGNAATARATGADDATRRAKNLEVIKKFLGYTEGGPGSTRTQDKAKLYYGEGSYYKIPFYLEGKHTEFLGLDAINKQEDINASNFARWEFRIKEIIECADPDKFWLKIHGVGTLIAGGAMKQEMTLSPMLLFFQMKEGKILGWEEYFNPLAMYAQAGVKVPSLY
jgi:hypothetical protein